MGNYRTSNREGKAVSLQVSILQNVPAGDFFPGVIFLIKNITDDNITIQIRPAGQDNFIETVLYPGWNPEICEVINNYTKYIYLRGTSVELPSDVKIATSVNGTWNKQAVAINLIYPGPFADLYRYRVASTIEELEEAVWQVPITPTVVTDKGVTTTTYDIPYLSSAVPMVKGSVYKFYVQVKDENGNESEPIQTSNAITYYNPPRINPDTFRVGEPGQVLLNDVDYPVHMDFLYGDPDEIKLQAGFPSPKSSYVPYVKGQAYTVKFVNDYDTDVIIDVKVTTPMGEMPFYWQRLRKQVRG